MAAVRLAGVLSIVLATALTGQTTSTRQVTFTVFDQSGAVIPGARIGVVSLPPSTLSQGDRLNYAHSAPEQASAETDLYGEASANLTRGSYILKISARGYRRYFERIEIRDEPNQSLRATLVVASGGGPVMVETLEMPLEAVSLDLLIPLEPLQTVTFTRRLRRH